jgi:glycosyltransferase involved in cell wall biosynthesis
LLPVFRWLGTRALARQCKQASCVAYVTRDSLQKKYPVRKEAFTTYYSSLSLKDEDFVDRPRKFSGDAARLVFVGSLAQMYKGADVLLEALAKMKIDVQLTVIGDGKHRGELERQAHVSGLAERVRFLGELSSGRAVRDELDRAELFVLPSRTEGLPRAMIEAMARALPCVGTTVGGIPELLSEDEMVPAGDPGALASRLEKILKNPGRLNAMSARNVERSQAFRPRLLAERRNELYAFLRNTTERWQGGRGA